MSNTQLKKLELLEWLASLQDQKLIDELMKWKDSHRRVSIEQYNRELEEANALIDAGEYVTHGEVKKAIKIMGKPEIIWDVTARNSLKKTK